ncbi:calcium-dependent channel, 7TM region, putative phosphate [Artemisia annua]|uniref:Calcium-dependent channel, 7TM region, putative phosphate n=1 Tax=Artemisia annua TaxID=35608 RepID=A0A2U1QD01_ARTAN|nr:calcium-dependent channel, 7TM region, putative phosphate [Artemisia annua]
MASLGDIGVSALINIITAFAFLIAFALLRIQPINDRVYFSKWYISGARTSPRHDNIVSRFVNLDCKTYLSFLNWMPQALRMKEPEIIQHAGLDSAAFLRIYLLGLKIFGPAAIVAFLVLIPVNVSGGMLFFFSRELVTRDIDKLSISNVREKSPKLFAHISVMYLFTFWSCYMLYKEYDVVASMRLNFLASKSRRVEQFTVLVKNVPRIPGRSVSNTVDCFFKKNHSTHYLCHQVVYNANKYARVVRKRQKLQNRLDYNRLKFERHPEKPPTRKTGFLGLWGEKVGSIEYYQKKIKELDEKLTTEHHKILNDPKRIMPAAFVSFNSRWGAAVCAQTQQSKNPILWLTDWAPEPRDIYWKNLAIPFVSLSIRKLVISLAVFTLVFFYIIPIAFVQSLANLEGLEKVVPFLRPVIELNFIKSFLQGFLPGLALKIFLWLLPGILMTMSKIEGHVAFSVLETSTASKYYFFMLVNVFLGSIATGTAIEQLQSFLHESPTQIPRTIGVAIPMKATFFITYIMVDGWAGMAGEILRLKPLIMFHLKSMLLVKTDRDKTKAMNPKSIDFPEAIPSLQLYFLMGAVYAVVTPVLLPFILIFFAFAFFVYRHQVINVYNQRYESAAAFWPHVHTRIVASLMISQLLLMGLLSTKKAVNSTPLLIVLPVLTLTFHKYCKSRFEPAFRKYPLEEAVEKDAQDEGSEPTVDIIPYMCEAYLHPVLRSIEEFELFELGIDNNQSHIPNQQLPTKPVSGSHSPISEQENKGSPKMQQHVEVAVEQHQTAHTCHHKKSTLNMDVTHY